MHLPQVGVTELAPLSQDRQGVSPPQGIQLTLAIGQPIGVLRLHVLHRLGIVHRHLGAGGQQAIDQHQGWCLANVVGPGFERQSPDGNFLLF